MSSIDELQDFYMKNEFCFHVDENDTIIGTLSKYQAHRIDPITLKAPLHRAFSVFLLKPNGNGEYDLLLQQRSKQKLTFPLLWANSCCSHPIEGLGEDTEDVVTGIVKAARRKLNHELGIPLDIIEKSRFYHFNRIHYHSNQEPWGEHEIDHILLVEADSNLIETIEINENEVAAIKFVPISQLNCLDQLELTPWLQKILKIDALGKWIDEFKDLSSNSSSNYMNSMIITTKYSTGPIIKLS